MSKKYVLDTNVLLNSLDTITDIIKNGNVPVIPLMVMEELDKFKGRGSNEELKFKARKIIRFIRKNEKDLEFVHNLRDGWEWFLKENDMDSRYQDNKILMLDILTQEDATLITGDQAMYYKAKTLKIDVMFTEVVKATNKKYTGLRQHLISMEAYKDLCSTKQEEDVIELDMLETITDLDLKDIHKNEFVEFMNREGKSIIFRQKDCVLGVQNRREVNGFIKVNSSPFKTMGISPANHGQIMLSNLLRDPKINIVTVNGSQGTGKTLFALAQALSDVEHHIYDRLLLAKDVTPLSKMQYQGFTKGTTEEKLLSHFGNYTSNIEMLYESEIKHGDLNNGMDKLLDLISKGGIEILDISSIKGTSYDNKIIIVDEAQTLTNKDMFAIVTRVKDNCKLILIGDLNQGAMVDLRRGDVGLETVTEKFMDYNRIGHVTLTETMRGEVQCQVFDALSKKED